MVLEWYDSLSVSGINGLSISVSVSISVCICCLTLASSAFLAYECVYNNGVTLVLQWCYSSVTMVLLLSQWFYISVTVVYILYLLPPLLLASSASFA
jgi:hypothetical protein